MPYASLESVIEENKDPYYAALRRTQDEVRPDWGLWVTFFLRRLKRQKDKLAQKLEHERLTGAELERLRLGRTGTR